MATACGGAAACRVDQELPTALIRLRYTTAAKALLHTELSIQAGSGDAHLVERPPSRLGVLLHVHSITWPNTTVHGSNMRSLV